jgi:hypothetical protein
VSGDEDFVASVPLRIDRVAGIGEGGGERRGPVLKQYVKTATKTRPYFTATQDDPAEDFVAEADRHHVFELIEVST